MLRARLATNLLFNVVLALWVLHDARTRHARKPVFAAVMSDAGGLGGDGAGASVQVLDVVQSTEPLRKVRACNMLFELLGVFGFVTARHRKLAVTLHKNAPSVARSTTSKQCADCRGRAATLAATTSDNTSLVVRTMLEQASVTASEGRLAAAETIAGDAVRMATDAGLDTIAAEGLIESASTQLRVDAAKAEATGAAIDVVALSAVRDWEQGRRQPERSARILLKVVEKEPEAVTRALAKRA